MASTSIRDNHNHGSVGQFLREKIKENSDLSFVSAFFTIYGYEALKSELEKIKSLRFLYGDPSFTGSVDPSKGSKKIFKIEDENIELRNVLEQRRIARECADWIMRKAEIRSVNKANFLHGKMYHIYNNGIEDAIVGSSNFTTRGLGLSAQKNIELNLEVDSRRDRQDLKNWFDQLLNSIVYELYILQLSPVGLNILKQVDHLPELKENWLREKKLEIIESVFKELSDPSHPVSVAMAKMLEIEEVKIIEGRG